MIDILAQLNWLAVLVGGIICMMVGGLWYGPIAGKAWMEEMNLTEEEIKASGSPAPTMIKSFVASLVLSAGLGVMIIKSGVAVGDWLGGAVMGAVLAIIIVGGATFPNYAFEDKNLRHFIIHIGNNTVGMALVGALMAAWR